MSMPIIDDILFCLEMIKYMERIMCIKEQFKAEGKRAFRSGKNTFDLNPYPHTSWISAHDFWLEGWREAAVKYVGKKHSFGMNTTNSYNWIWELNKGEKICL
jgi:ribosome modulation factor